MRVWRVIVRGVAGLLRRPQICVAAAALCAVYIFLQSPPLWFLRILPCEIPQTDGEGDRVLIISPHPDDDVLGAGSSIAAFREAGAQVLVVFLTSGDANVAGQWLITMNPLRLPAEFRAIGQRRQKEAVVALERLGVPATHAVFLNYPDRGLTELLESHWSALEPFRSPYTKSAAKYSSAALNAGGPYCGEALLEDLKAIIGGFRPTIVYVPHPLDAHEDHRAGYAFTTRAVAEVRAGDDEFGRPSLRYYLVHSYAGVWPEPSKVSTVLAMEPLDGFLELGVWHSTPLSAQAIDAKYRALRAHASQWWTCGQFLARFVCSNELYMVDDT